MLSGANNSRHGELKDYLENMYTCGEKHIYPTNTTDVLARMNDFRTTKQQEAQRRNPGRTTGTEESKDDDDGLQFVQEGTDDNDENEGQAGVNMLMRGQQQKNEMSYADI